MTRALPATPGVYRFRDERGTVLYIGRAVDLRRRVQSYWGELRDRRHLSEDGVLIVVATLGAGNGSVASRPELIARGFAEPGEPLLEEMREEAQRVLDELMRENVTEIKLLQEHLHDGLGQLIYDRTKRRPMILPVVVEV